MEKLISKKMALEAELNSITINEEEIERKVAEYRNQLYANITKENEERIEKIKIKLEIIDELIDEEIDEAIDEEEAEENEELDETEENEDVVLQINEIPSEEASVEENNQSEEETVVSNPVHSIFR